MPSPMPSSMPSSLSSSSSSSSMPASMPSAGGRLSHVLPAALACQSGLPGHHHHHHHHHPEQHQHAQIGHAAAAAAAAAASMGMESSELVAVAHYQAQQLQRQLLAEQSGAPMLNPSVQPAAGGLTGQPHSAPPLQQGQQPQAQGQDPLQSLVQQLLCLQQIEYFLAQRGHK